MGAPRPRPGRDGLPRGGGRRDAHLGAAAGPGAPRGRRPQHPYRARLRARGVHHGLGGARVRTRRGGQRRTRPPGRRSGRPPPGALGPADTAALRAQGRRRAPGALLPPLRREAPRHGARHPGDPAGAWRTGRARRRGRWSVARPARTAGTGAAASGDLPRPCRGSRRTRGPPGRGRRVPGPGPLRDLRSGRARSPRCGTPVVASASSALPEIVGGAGAAAADTPRTFAHAVRAVLERPEHIRRAMARARAECFGWDVSVRAFLAAHGAEVGVGAAAVGHGLGSASGLGSSSGSGFGPGLGLGSGFGFGFGSNSGSGSSPGSGSGFGSVRGATRVVAAVDGDAAPARDGAPALRLVVGPGAGPDGGGDG